ncbi:MAG: hypothetical protein WC495_04505 [Patescibacteria group bacterium]|jgi:hypothetical protein
MKKNVQPSGFSSSLAKATKVILGVIIGGVLASTSIAVGARSLDYISVISNFFDEFEPTVQISLPVSGEYVGLNSPIRIYAAANKGMNRVELYVRHDISPELIATAYGYGPNYRIAFDSSKYADHSFVTLYAVAYTRGGRTVTSEYTHLRIEKCSSGEYCAKVFSGAQGDQRMRQTITGLVVGQTYAVEYSAKKATSDGTSVRVLSTDEQESYAICDSELYDYTWNPGYECTFTAQTTDALLVVNSKDNSIATYSTDSYLYIDDISIHPIQSQTNLVVNPTFETGTDSWQGTGFTRLSVTPVTPIKPFSPSVIYLVKSNLPIQADQNLGFWFYKGWPQSHFTLWTKLGSYQRPSLYNNPTGAYEYIDSLPDLMKWYSPLVIWFPHQSFDTANFNFTDIKLTVTTDKGTLDICIPDINWESPLINSIGIRGLVVDEHGNTYYAYRYDDPDLLQSDNIAKRCTCSDGTQIGSCNTAGTQSCNAQGELVAADCRVCGCSSSQLCLEDKISGAWSCETHIVPVDDEIE